jgi:dTDP-4-dehydrorhamnose reductase
VVADQVLGPSYTLDVARAVWQVIAAGHAGLCHVTSAGETSWHDFAREIFRLEGLAPALSPVTSAEFGARAKRPAYSVLAHRALAALGIAEPRGWDAALAAYLAERRGLSAPARPGS